MKTPALLLLVLSHSQKVIADDSARLNALFAPVAVRGGVETIPPREDDLDGDTPLTIASHITACAYGARFHLPRTPGDKTRDVMFSEANVSHFRWFGRHFTRRVFNPAKMENSWGPNTNTHAILISTTPGGRSENLTFRGITSAGMAGAVMTVPGAQKKGSDRDVEMFARNVTAENSPLERSGKFMWDYGDLWQITV